MCPTFRGNREVIKVDALNISWEGIAYPICPAILINSSPVNSKEETPLLSNDSSSRMVTNVILVFGSEISFQKNSSGSFSVGKSPQTMVHSEVPPDFLYANLHMWLQDRSRICLNNFQNTGKIKALKRHCKDSLV